VKNKYILRITLIACLLGLSAGLHAADDSGKKAGQLLDKHYYESAALALRSASAGGEPTPVVALMLARAYARNAELYRSLQRSSLTIGNMYLQKLSAQTGRDRSLFVPLYYGEYLIQSGKLRDGAAQLHRFIEQKDSAPTYRDIAQAILAVAQKAVPPVAQSSDPLVRSQLAAAISLSSVRRAEAATQTDQALAELSKANPILPVRAVTNAIGVYARSGQAEKAFALLGAADIGRPSYEEAISSSKVLRFYDAALFGNLAELDQAEAERLLQRVRSDAKYKAVASYFLVELYLNNEQFGKAVALLPELNAATDLPAAYRDRLAVMQAALDVRSGKAPHGNAEFAGLGQKYAQDPALLAEVLSACVHFKASCPGVTASARTLAAANQGERYRSLHFAVGEQYAAIGKNDLALLEMETARDKSNKNRIDANDPMLLVRLADLYFAGKSFSESLEIYFEMSREFPAVRQLQETGQGVYSTEYRSAGDAKIF
jgi:tetratricopeptide (TPR) repeat protein